LTIVIPEATSSKESMTKGISLSKVHLLPLLSIMKKAMIAPEALMQAKGIAAII